MAGHGDERYRTEAMRHVFGEARLAAAGRTFEQHGELFLVRRLEHFHFRTHRKIKGLFNRNEFLEGKFMIARFGHGRGFLCWINTLISHSYYPSFGESIVPSSPRMTCHPTFMCLVAK